MVPQRFVVRQALQILVPGAIEVVVKAARPPGLHVRILGCLDGPRLRLPLV